jgi:hypothetical protein
LVLANNYTTTTTQLKPMFNLEIKFMIPQLFVESIDLGDGRNITIETGRLANKLMVLVVRIGKLLF